MKLELCNFESLLSLQNCPLLIGKITCPSLYPSIDLSILTLPVEPPPGAPPEELRKFFGWLPAWSKHQTTPATLWPPALRLPSPLRTETRGLASVRVTFLGSLRWRVAAELFSACRALICIWLLFVLNYMEERLSSDHGGGEGWGRIMKMKKLQPRLALMPWCCWITFLM